MILSAILCVAMAQTPPPRTWVEGRNPNTGEAGTFWAFETANGWKYWPNEQAEARRRHTQYLTGVVPGKVSSDTKQVRASDQASADFGQAVLTHAAHEAGKPCPDGKKCPNQPKEPQPEARRTPNIPFSQETIAAVALVVVGLFLYFRGSNGQRAE